MGYSMDKIWSIYDNFVKIIRFTSESEIGDKMKSDQKLCYTEDNEKYYSWFSNNSLWYDYEITSSVSYIFEKNWKIRVIYLINSDENYDEFLMTSMIPKVDVLKIVKDKHSWFVPTKFKWNFLANLKWLKIGYTFYSSASSYIKDDTRMLSELLAQWSSLRVLWIWGFHINSALKSLSLFSDLELYEFRYSESGIVIEEVLLESETIRVNSSSGKVCISTDRKTYEILYSEDSVISMRMIKQVDEHNSIGILV